MRRLVYYPLIALAGLLLVLSGLGAGVQTKTGRNLLVRGVEFVSSHIGPIRIQLDGLGPGFPLALNLNSLQLADSNGTWLSAEDIRLAWKPAALLRGTLQVTTVSAQQATWHRPPQTPHEENEKNTPPWWLLRRLRLETLALPELRLARPDDPSFFTLNVHGRFSGDEDHGLTAEIALQEPRGADHVTATARFHPSSKDYSLNAHANASAQGPLARLTTLPGPWQGRVAANGTRRRGTGEAELHGPRVGSAVFNYQSTAQPQGLATTLRGNITPDAALLPPDLADWLQPGVRLDMELLFPEKAPETFRVQQMRLSNRHINLAAHGSWNNARQILASRLDLELATLPAHLPPGLTLPETVHFNGEMEGNWPELSAKLRTQPLAVTYRAPNATSHARVTNASLQITAESTAPRAWHARVQANGNCTSHSPIHAAGHVRGQATLKTPDLRQWEIPESEVAINHIPVIQGNGSFHTATKAARGSLRLLPATRDVLQGAATLPRGWPKGTARAAFSGHLAPLDLNGTLQTKMQTPRHPKALSTILGTNATLDAAWGADAQGNIRIDDLRLTTPRTRLWGAGNLNTQSHGLAARLHLHSQPLIRPSAADAVLTEAISGTLDAQGTVDAPALTLTLRTPHLFPGAPFALRSVNAQAQISTGSQGIAGPVEIQGNLGEHRTRLRTAFAWHNATLFLRSLQGNWGPGTLRGNLQLRPGPKRLQGSLTARAPLTLLEPYLDQSLQGEAHARLNVNSEPESPFKIQGSVRCEQARWGETLRIKSLSSEFDIRKTPSALTGSGNLQLSELHQGDWHLESGRITASGRHDDLALNAFLRGASNETPFSATANGTLQRNAAEDWRLHLEHIKGSATPSLDFRLTQSATLEKQGDTWSVRLPELALGPGSLSLQGQWAPTSVSGKGTAQGLPLASLTPFLPKPLVGRADTTFQLSGSPQKPHLQGTLNVTNGKLRQGRWKTVPTLDGQASWDWRPGTLQAALTAEQKGANATLRASATVPLTLSLAPLRLTPQPQEPCQGELDMGADLKILPRILDIEGMRSNGRFTANATLNGTWQDPKLQGTAQLEQGRFEHVYQGIVLEDITAHCQADAQGVHDLHLNGTDGAEGTFNVQGAIPFRPTPRAELTARLDHLALIRLDQLQSVLSGKMQLQGPFKTASLQGMATLERTEIRLPEQMPPSVSGVDITNTHTAQSHSPKPSSADSQPISLDLDLDLSIPRRFFVRGRGLEAEFKGQCHVGGSTQKPKLQGELEAVWGRFTFFSKTLTIETGQLFFENHTPPDPRLNVAAEHSENDFLARIWLTGPMDNPGIRMESEPQLPEEEILGRILFGRSVSSLNPLQAVRLAQALRSLSTGRTGGSLTTKFFDKTRKLLELDEIGVSSGDGGPSIGMGKYLQENVYLRAQKGLESSEDKISVEIELSPHINVDSQVGGQGRSGVGLNWKLDY